MIVYVSESFGNTASKFNKWSIPIPSESSYDCWFGRRRALWDIINRRSATQRAAIGGSLGSLLWPTMLSYLIFVTHIVGATPLVDSGPSNLLIRWPTLLIRWPTLLFRDPLCWFGFPLCWCGSTKLEKWESESEHRPECWFGSCLESTFWSMPKHRIYKVGHIYNLHGPRINKVCHV